MSSRSLIYLCFIFLFSCGFSFPDNLPALKSADVYAPKKLEFQKTTVSEFNKLCPKLEPYNVDSTTLIFTSKPKEASAFSEVNVGFKDETLNWLEFTLATPTEINEIIAIYGFPKYIDAEYSNTIDYYNYGNFSISTDKEHKLARSITFFGPPDQMEDPYSRKFFEVFSYLKPGVTTENEFTKNFTDLLPYMEGEYETSSTYTLREELGGAQNIYKKAIVHFENGLLTWINLIPANSDLKRFLKKFKESHQIEEIDDNYDFYIFENFVLTVEREPKKIINIGIVSFDERF